MSIRIGGRVPRKAEFIYYTQVYKPSLLRRIYAFFFPLRDVSMYEFYQALAYMGVTEENWNEWNFG